MKAVLDETSIRRLVREGIVRRMLREAPEGDYSDVPTFDFSSLGRRLFGGGDAGQTERPLSKGFPSGRKRGEGSAEAIARVVEGTADKDPDTGASYVGPRLGESIKDFISSVNYVRTPFVVQDSANALDEWNQAVNDEEIPVLVELDENGNKTSKELDAVQGEEGLLRYLIAVKGAEMGFEIKLNDLEKQLGDYKQRLQPVVKIIHSAIDGYTGASDINIIAMKMREIVRADKTPQLLESKLVLAGFARDNGTTGELLEPVGWILLVAASVAAVYFTGGLALAAIQPLAAGSGLAVAGWSAATLASSALALWGLTEAGESALNEYYDSPIGDLIAATNKPEEGFEYLDEMSREVSRTWFPLDSTAAYRRDALASVLSLIAGTDPDRAEILQKLDEVIP